MHVQLASVGGRVKRRRRLAQYRSLQMNLENFLRSSLSSARILAACSHILYTTLILNKSNLFAVKKIQDITCQQKCSVGVTKTSSTQTSVGTLLSDLSNAQAKCFTRIPWRNMYSHWTNLASSFPSSKPQLKFNCVPKYRNRPDLYPWCAPQRARQNASFHSLPFSKIDVKIMYKYDKLTLTEEFHSFRFSASNARDFFSISSFSVEKNESKLWTNAEQCFFNTPKQKKNVPIDGVQITCMSEYSQFL